MVTTPRCISGLRPLAASGSGEDKQNAQSKDRGGGEEPPMAGVQLTSELEVMPSVTSSNSNCTKTPMRIGGESHNEIKYTGHKGDEYSKLMTS